MDFKNLLTPFDIRSAYHDLPVKTAGTQDSRIQDIHPVCGCQNDDSFIDSETVHLHQKLVQSLLPLIVASSQAGASLSGNCIDLVDKYDTGRVLLSLFKQVPDSGSAYAYEHLHKIGTGDTEERNP